MKKIIYIFLFALMLTACVSKTKTEKDIMTVTIDPERFFLEKLVGERFSINTLVPPGSSPETYEPTPTQMVNLSKSRAYFKVGLLGYERSGSKKIKENNPEIEIVDCSVGINLITHEHNADSHHKCASAADPHVWSSPKSVITFSKNMLDALIRIDSANAGSYKDNYEKLKSLINRTDSTISQILSGSKTRSFMIYHPALGYFARDYNLNQICVESEGKSPSASKMKELVGTAKKENIKVIFIQPEFDDKNVKVIANELGLKIYKVNPLAYDWDQELIRIAKIIANNGE